MNTFNINTPFFNKKGNCNNIHTIDFESILSKSVHCVHQQIKSLHDCVHKVFIQPFIFGGIFLNDGY